MRRINAVNVKVKAPSRGLVTRWPGETADQLATGVDKFSLPGMANRVATFATNMRYEDGVMKNAPGYVKVQGADSLVAHWPLDEATGTRFDSGPLHLDLTEHPTVDQVTGQINFAAHFPGSSGGILAITGYEDGVLTNPFGGGGSEPVWDGTFPWYDSNTNRYFGSEVNTTLQISGGAICKTYLRTISGGWRMLIGSDQNGTNTLWVGELSGDSPIGVYTNNGQGFNPSSPASYTVAQISGTQQDTVNESCDS